LHLLGQLKANLLVPSVAAVASAVVVVEASVAVWLSWSVVAVV
jgi:hypothetical protein